MARQSNRRWSCVRGAPGGRRWIALGVLALACSVGCERGPGRNPEADPNAPNVILLVIDTLRADHIHGYGYPRETTPTLDRFIREGVRFDAAIAASSWSPPSHVTILTGTNPDRHKVFTFGFPIPAGIDPLAVHLKARGYATGMFSTHMALHRSVGRIREGLDTHFVDKRSDVKALAAALTWVKTVKQPYFLYMVLTSPHAPYDQHPPEYDRDYFHDTPPDADKTYPFAAAEWVGEGGIPTSVRMNDENTVGYYVDQYDREIRYLDDLIGRFWSSMEEAGLLGNTLLVVTSDHGEGLGDHDTFAHELYLYDFLVRVPLIVRHPERVPAGRVWSGQVPLADIVPTILGFAGAPIPDALDGVDLSGALSTADGHVDPRLATASYRHRGFDRYMVRSDDYKLLYDAKADREELYDLRADPAEQHDLLAAGPDAVPADAYALLAAAMRIQLEHHGRIAANREPEPLDPEVLEELRALGYATPE